MKKLLNLIILFSSLITALVLCEIFLRAFYKPNFPAAGWRTFFPENQRNQLGFRGRPIVYDSSEKVIILLGDSQAEGEGSSFSMMPEQRLERHLDNSGIKAKVFTLGAGGYGQDQQLLALKEYFRKYRADMVVLWQTPKNDIWNNMFPTHWPKDGMIKPTFILRDDSLEGPIWNMGEELFHSRFTTISLIKQVLAPRSLDRYWERYLPEPYKPLSEYEGNPDMTWQKYRDDSVSGFRMENLDNEKSHLAMWLTPRSRRMEYGLKLTQKLISRIENTAKSHKSGFICFYLSYPDEDPLRRDTTYCLIDRYYRSSNNQFRLNMKYINNRFDSYIIPVTTEKWRAGRYDSHLNEKAIDQVTENLAAVITEKLSKQDKKINGQD